MDLQYTTPNALSLLKRSGSVELLVMSKISVFLINYIFMILEQPVLRSHSLIITNPDISFMKDVSVFMNLYPLGFRSTSVFDRKEWICSGNEDLNPYY